MQGQELESCLTLLILGLKGNYFVPFVDKREDGYDVVGLEG